MSCALSEVVCLQNDQIKSIEETKLTSKKRKGVAPFIKYFPTYISRVETQLIGADTLEIRQTVDAAYDRIVQAMFDALKQMAKMGSDEEDKSQLNYHVILIGSFSRSRLAICILTRNHREYALLRGGGLAD